jgi:hypothetical protein
MFGSIPLPSEINKEKSFFFNEEKFFNLSTIEKKQHFENVCADTNEIRCPFCNILLQNWNKLNHIKKCINEFEECFTINEKKNIIFDKPKKSKPINATCLIKKHSKRASTHSQVKLKKKLK